MGLKDPKKESDAITKFRNVLIKKNKVLEEQIKETPDKYIKDIANNLMKYIFSYDDLKNVDFFFVSPKFRKEKLENYIKSHGMQIDLIEKTINHFVQIFEAQKKKINPLEINKKCSEYLYDNRKTLTNNDVFKFLKYVLTGTETPLLFSEVCEMLGKERIIERMKKVEEIFKK